MRDNPIHRPFSYGLLRSWCRQDTDSDPLPEGTPRITGARPCRCGLVLLYETADRGGDCSSRIDRGDFAVLVTDDEQATQKLNDLGCADPVTARVLFTTQQRLQLVCAKRDFSDVQVYHFRGVPRQVRI